MVPGEKIAFLLFAISAGMFFSLPAYLTLTTKYSFHQTCENQNHWNYSSLIPSQLNGPILSDDKVKDLSPLSPGLPQKQLEPHLGNQTAKDKPELSLSTKPVARADDKTGPQISTKHMYREYPVAKLVNSKRSSDCGNHNLCNLEMNLTHHQEQYFVTLNGYLPSWFTFVLNNPEFCQQTYAEVLIYIISSPNHFETRQGLRSTWAKSSTWSNRNFSAMFFVGKPSSTEVQQKLEEEFHKHGDLIQADMTDTYQNLTLKEIVAVQWMNTFCPRVKYVLKADDDLAVDIRHISEIISRQIMPSTHVETKVLCLYHTTGKPFRNPRAKYYIPSNVLPHLKFYPPFCLGSFYGYPAFLLPRLQMAAMTTPLFWLEDVHFSGFLLPQLEADDMKFVDIKQIWSGRKTQNTFIKDSTIKIFFGIPLKYLGKYWSDILDRYSD